MDHKNEKKLVRIFEDLVFELVVIILIKDLMYIFIIIYPTDPHGFPKVFLYR